MHRELIEHIDNTKLKESFIDIISMVKETNHDLYEKIETYLYKQAYGCHFSDWLLEKATSKMENEDGTIGAHWKVDQTTQFARTAGITFTEFNEYDWNYVMNMLYSDFYGVINTDSATLTRFAKKFLIDKDAPHGKALLYYFAMKDK